MATTYLVPILYLLAALIAGFFGSYIREKGKNVATREDIEHITRKVESIKHELDAPRIRNGRIASISNVTRVMPGEPQRKASAIASKRPNNNRTTLMVESHRDKAPAILSQRYQMRRFETRGRSPQPASPPPATPIAATRFSSSPLLPVAATRSTLHRFFPETHARLGGCISVASCSVHKTST